MNTRRKFIQCIASLAFAGFSGFIPFKLLSAKDMTALFDAKDTYGSNYEPSYLKLHRTGELKNRGMQLWEMMNRCTLCPRECERQRLRGVKGKCNATDKLQIASFNPHFGEEKELSGTRGSGTIFFSNCSLKCVFCINWEISQGGYGTVRTIDELSEMMLHLQKIGCHNINVVTPTHYIAHIILALDKAAGRGLKLPLVYNSSGWEKIEVLKLLEGVVDIYLPDFKYSNAEMANKYSPGASNYPEVTKAALLEMHRQVGVAKPAKDGLIYRGLMIRHLVMPNNVSGTKEVLEWIANNLPKDTYVNIMSQYQPVYKAVNYPEINRRITRAEYDNAIQWAKEYGMTNIEIQGWRHL